MRYLLPFILLSPLQAADETLASLQAKLMANNPANSEKIIPGNPMKIVATVKNTSNLPTAPAKLYLKFIFPEPLEKEPNSLLFTSDKLPLPSLLPGQEIEIPFNLSKHWPSLFDFVRYDWGVRQFQAVVVSETKEFVIGTLSIVFSAYYYDGPAKELPQKVPVKSDKKPKKIP